MKTATFIIIIIALVLIIIALFFAGRSDANQHLTLEKDFNALSRKNEEEQLLRYQLERQVKQQQETLQYILQRMDAALKVDTSMYHTRMVSDFEHREDLEVWREAINNRIGEYKTEVAKGNRKELEDRLYEFWGAIGYPDFTFDDFMHEFTTLPGATLNRIIVKVTRG